jgi:hypothetical protein
MSYSQAFLALAVGQEDASTPSLKVTVDAGSILSNWGEPKIGGVGWEGKSPRGSIGNIGCLQLVETMSLFRL